MNEAASLPATGISLGKMPGHWLLAQMGKRVLRPGGLELTREMLGSLEVRRSDHVVELAPGLGVTTRATLQMAPATYTGVERDPLAAARVRRLLRPSDRCIVGSAARTGLAPASASVVYGEAMLTMQTAAQKSMIIREAARVLAPGGRYGIHELGLGPADLDDAIKAEVSRDLSSAIHVGARPLLMREWRQLLEEGGFDVIAERTAPMHLLEPSRVVRDEGLLGAARIAFNVMRSPAARARVFEMRRAFRKHQAHIEAVMLVARKRPPG